MRFLYEQNQMSGRRLDPERATAIKDMPTPDNGMTLQSFLGLANYYQSFIKKSARSPLPAKQTTKKDKKWRWTPECQTTFDQSKKGINIWFFFTHYDPKLVIIVTSDASSYGVGSCILPKMPDGTKKPIAHASRTLFLTEKHYSQIKKEALGIIFLVTKFYRYYIYIYIYMYVSVQKKSYKATLLLQINIGVVIRKNRTKNQSTDQ